MGLRNFAEKTKRQESYLSNQDTLESLKPIQY